MFLRDFSADPDLSRAVSKHICMHGAVVLHVDWLYELSGTAVGIENEVHPQTW